MPTVKELKQLAKDKGCKGYSKLKKAELIDFVKVCDSKDNKDKDGLKNLKIKELRKLAKDKGCKGYSKLKKAELIDFVKKCLENPCASDEYYFKEGCSKIIIDRSREFKRSKDTCKKTKRKKYVLRVICDLIDKKLPGYYVYKSIGKGSYGETFLLCNKSKKICDKVVKIGLDTDYDDYKKEVKLQNEFSKRGFAPTILYSNYNGDEMVMTIIMDRIDDTLENYLLKKRRPEDINNVFERLEDIMKKIKKAGLVHGDFHKGNIGIIQKDNSVEPILIDFGFSEKMNPRIAQYYDELEIAQLYNFLKYDSGKIPDDNYYLVMENLYDIVKNRYGKQYLYNLEKLNIDDLIKFREPFYDTLQYKEKPKITLREFMGRI